MRRRSRRWSNRRLVRLSWSQATFEAIGEISDDEWRMTSDVNIHAMF
jgi:hypothetical protein